MLKLLEFNFTLEYKKGKDNVVADALSRKSHIHAISLITPKWTIEVHQSYEVDPKCKALMEKLLLSPNQTDQHDVFVNELIRHREGSILGTVKN